MEKDPEPIEPPIVRAKDSNEMINVLIGINGVGKKMARKLLDKFGKPSKVLTAKEKDLDDIPRLPEKVKKSILRL